MKRNTPPQSPDTPAIAPASGDGAAADPVLVSAIRRILRPLVRLLLAKGLTYPYLANLLKGIYVEVAASDFCLAGKAQTDSRLSLLTGVHRKDVRRLAHETAEEGAGGPVQENVSLGARLVARWCGDREFLDERGCPRTLPRQARGPGEPSFERLVAAESSDIRSRAVLDEWLRLGLVTVDEAQQVRLVTEAFVPQEGFAEKAFFFAHNVHDHLAASVHNLLDERPPLMERSVYYGRLGPEAVAELAALAERLGMDALHAVNQRARELQEASIAAQCPTPRRMTFGIYFFDAAQAPTHEEPPHAAPDRS